MGSPAAVAAAQEALGCSRYRREYSAPEPFVYDYCTQHSGEGDRSWTPVGCPVAVEVASKVAAATLRVHRSRRYCGCGWCCANNAPGVVPGDAHKNCSAQRARADEQETP